MTFFTLFSRASPAPAAGRPRSALGAQAAGNQRGGSARHPPVTGSGGGHAAVTGRQCCRALSGGSPGGAAAAAGTLARTPPRPVPPPSAGGHACKNERPSPSRWASSHRAKITVKGRACGALLRNGASPTP